jgi:rod shape-determining protein MreC
MTLVRTHPLLLLTLLVLVSLGLVALHVLGYLAPAERFAVQFVTPFQQGASRLVQGTRAVYLGLGDVRRLQAQNEQLRAEVDLLRALVIGLKEAENENRILRDQLGFIQANPAYDLLPAHVIGRDPNSFVQTIVIDKGARDGVRDGKVVVAAGRVSLPFQTGAESRSDDLVVVQGIVGRVIETGPNYARVLLISDLSSAVNVFVQGTQAEGLLAGQGLGNLVLKYVRQGERIAPGMILLTSGLGGTFPRGLGVGIITEVQTKDQATFQTATIVPVVDLPRLDIVFVIRSFDPIKVGS